MTSNPIRIWEGVSASKSKNLWGSQSISNINTIIKNNISGDYRITSATLNVYANFDGALGLANVYMKYGFGSTNSISTQLGGERKLTKDDANYPNSITSYISSDKKGISTSYGSHFVANIYTANAAVGSSGALHLSYVDLVVDYDLYHTVTVNVSPEGAGTVSGTGSYVKGSTATVKATPNAGYKFVGFGNSSGVVTVTTNPYVFTVNNNTTFYAIFEQIPPPEFTSVEIKYLDKQVSPSNKVIVNESFIISVGVT